LDANAVLTLLESPFPGLRSFETEEAMLFFGREAQTAELLRRLSESRFLAITGASGCGKSSLVYAGLLPALHCGYLVNATTRWRVATFRPGNEPIDALATALAKDGALASLDVETLRALLGKASGGLVEAVRLAGLAPGESLLVVADQFEELFRFAIENPGGANERSLFVSLLLHAVESHAPIYIVLTMRSEYQGACARFPGLPEALNRGQYLVSRMTREQCRQALVRPLELVGAGITPRLVNQMLNDAGNDPDELPVLQHAMLRTYRHWKATGGQGDIDLAAYEAKEVGGVAGALAVHGEGILARFANDRQLAEKIFRCLTKPEGRRPKKLGSIYEIVDATGEKAKRRVHEIIEAFARHEDSLLMLSSRALMPDTVVDITHESLIRQWPTLKGWVQEEAKSAEWYGDLVRAVVRKRTGDAGLWEDPAMAPSVLARSKQEAWNEAWARQYARPADNPPFAEVAKFLADSVKALESRRRRWIFLFLLISMLVGALGVVAYSSWQNRQKVRTELRESQAIIKVIEAKLRDTQEQLSHTAVPEQRRELDQRVGGLEQAIRAERAKVVALQLKSDNHNFVPTPVSVIDPGLVDENSRLRQELKDVKFENSGLTLSKIDASKKAEEDRKNIVDLTRRLANLQRFAVPSESFLLRQNSVVHFFPAPAAGPIAFGVGEIEGHDSGAEIQLYVWTSSLPNEFKERPDNARRLLDSQRRNCTATGTSGLLCRKFSKKDMRSIDKPAVMVTLGSVQYEIRVAFWPDDPDAILLLSHAVPPAAP